MIIGKIIGGLGNQMFQYAFYKNLSLLKKSELKLDLSAFKDYRLHNGFELNNVFSIKESAAIQEEIELYRPKNIMMAKIINRISNNSFSFGGKYFAEVDFRMNNRIFDERNRNFYVEGYFQSEELFRENNAAIRECFSFEKKLSENEKIVLGQNTVSIHIRGGDYLNNSKNMKLFGNICNEKYYESAMKKIEELIENPVYILFTNDIPYAAKILSGKQFYLVDWNKNDKSYRDMMLMSLCSHNIIANSSFSWWGAWLNNNSDKVVIAPEKWFNSKKIAQDKIIPQGWIRI